MTIFSLSETQQQNKTRTKNKTNKQKTALCRYFFLRKIHHVKLHNEFSNINLLNPP